MHISLPIGKNKLMASDSLESMGMQVNQGNNWMIGMEIPRQDKKKLVLSRVLDASLDRVWRAWTEPADIKAWWGPQAFTAPFIRIDLRPGGQYLYCMRSPEGKDFWSTGTIREVVALKKLVLTDSLPM
ncbi:MAG: SRPBCC domain-containing protein [Clostridiaceae bacterium]|jgi:uncharacterized protein YndB with AHSA1/START domain|nr:SRPBCC domain-containing protein [Clostridiaceae bacterium]